MRAVILQPSFLPWRGFFDLVYRSDVVVMLDDVQYDKHSWRNRNRIKTTNGPLWITVPVETKGKPRLNEARIVDARQWTRKLPMTIRESYCRAPFFDAYFGPLAELLGSGWTSSIAELDIALMQLCMGFLGLERRIVRSSDLRVETEDKNARLIELCRRVNADEYLSGPSAMGYINEQAFAEAGIRLEYMTYEYPPYPQLHGVFEPAVSVIDLLFNVGPDAKRYIWECRHDVAAATEALARRHELQRPADHQTPLSRDS